MVVFYLHIYILCIRLIQVLCMHLILCTFNIYIYIKMYTSNMNIIYIHNCDNTMYIYIYVFWCDNILQYVMMDGDG